MLSDIEVPPSGGNISVRKERPRLPISGLLTFSHICHRFRVICVNSIRPPTEAPTSGENNSIRKRDPDFLLVVFDIFAYLQPFPS
jgi:hypothetical protein